MPRITHLSFPELRLAMRDAHKLRGYFGRVFQEHSPLLHNHLEGGELRYAYPLVQYKVIQGVPTLLGINEGATLLLDLFLQIKEIDIDGRNFPLLAKNLECQEVEVAYVEELWHYRFATLFMALNQSNFEHYLTLQPAERRKELNRLLRNHLLAALKGMGVWLEPNQRIFADANLEQHSTQFKNRRMLAFSGEFRTNLILPPLLGIGKAVSRGFGAIEPVV
ncbi:MAG: DNA repair protein [Haliscomenobacter sp.]|nr:DNA repair protein [Haliscomenobacter sp.]